MIGPFRRSWWSRGRIILAVGIGLPLSLAILVAVKLFGDGDLLEIDDRARAMGLPTTWIEFAGPVSPQEQLDRWNRVAALKNALKPWRKTQSEIFGFAPSSPLPEALISHHQGLDPLQMDELMNTIDALCAKPLQLHQVMDYSVPIWDMIIVVDITKLLGERIALADHDAAAVEVLRALRFIETAQAPTTPFNSLVRVSQLASLCSDATYRIADLRRGSGALVDELERLADSTISGLPHQAIGEFVIQRSFLQDPGNHAVAIGSAIPSTASSILVRMGRGPSLDHALDWIDLFKSEHDALRLATAAKKLTAELSRRPSWDPSYILALRATPDYESVLKQALRMAMQLRLLAAELKGAPWPIDLCDPQAQPLRRIEHDGSLIGAYSFGKDGVDDGGDTNKDFVWPLYGPIEPPQDAP